MFQLYKKRNFSAIFNDTFNFFRIEGKNYFGNFLKITGGLLLVLIVLGYLCMNVFFENMFNGITNPQQSNMLENYFSDNMGFFIGVGIIVFLLMMMLSAIAYAFPVIYLKFISENINPSASQMMKGILKSFGKIVLFVLLSLITFLPIAALLMTISILLVIIIIGIPVAIFVGAFLVCWTLQTFYHYLTTDDGYFASMGKGYNSVFANFWGHVGATAIFIIIVYTVQMIASLLPYMIGGFMTMTDVTPGNQDDALSSLGILMMVSFMLSYVLAYLLSNFIIVNQGMIYYSSREAEDNTSLHSDIDLIGSDIE